MLQLRDYQRAALDALYEYWAEGGGNGLIVLPTGAGKALVIAKMIDELLRDYPDMRIFNVTHSASLVEQNFKEFIGLCPFAPAGIYSASLGQRDTRAQVLFCGIQSVCNKVEILGAPDLIVVDEAHAISRNGNTQYGKFLAETLAINPERRVAGTTATDYRLDSGRLTEGDDRLFDDVVYEAKLTDLIEQGYLTRLVSAKTTSKIDLKGVGTRGGDYIPGQVSTAAERIIEDAVAEDMVLSEGRRAALFFSASKENATHIAECVRRHGRPCAVLTSDNSHETKKIFADFRAGNLWAISSVNMIGTGTNFPFVDFLSLIFSTKSAGKLVQWLGRGTRNCEGKVDCLVADHGKNLAYHGPIDQIRPKAPGESTGEQPVKLCPQDNTDVEGKTGCGELIPISRMICHCCGYIFPPSEEEKITAKAAIAPVLSTAPPVWHVVTGRTFREHPPKPGKPPSVRVDFRMGMTIQKQWLSPRHPNFQRFWAAHGGLKPFPKSAEEFLNRAEELRVTAEIQVGPDPDNPKYMKVNGWRAGAAAQAAEPANDNWKPLMAAGETLDDMIPF